jgi:hypothetical protein
MDHEKVLQLPGNVKYNRFIGITDFDIVRHATGTELNIKFRGMME